MRLQATDSATALAVRGCAPDGVRELASGFDAFYVSGEAALSEALLGDLGELKEVARSCNSGVPWTALGDGFEVKPGPLHMYPYRVDHRWGSVGLTDSPRLPSVRIQPRSEFIQAEGPLAAPDWFRERLEPACGPIAMTVCRLDLFADYQGWGLDGDRRRHFVGRGTTRNTRETNDKLSGFEFGRRKSKTVVARIYDKTVESRAKGLAHWPAVWGERYVKGERVLRVEFEFLKKGLGQFGVAAIDEAIDAAPKLWAYGTEQWLRLTMPTNDETASRWPVDPVWEQIQHCRLRGDAFGAERIDLARRASGIDALIPALRGYLASVGAYGGCSSLEDTLAYANRVLLRDERRTGVSFSSRLVARCRELGLR